MGTPLVLCREMHQSERLEVIAEILFSAWQSTSQRIKSSHCRSSSYFKAIQNNHSERTLYDRYLRWNPLDMPNRIHSSLTKPFHRSKPLLSCPKYSRLFCSPIIWILVFCTREKGNMRIKSVLCKLVTGKFPD